MAALCTVTAATQPALMRFGATRLDPMLFAAGCAVVATLWVLPVVYARGELGLLVDRRYRMRLLTLSIIGTVVTTLTLIFGLRHIDAVAGTNKTGSAIAFGSGTTITFANGVSTAGGSLVLYKAESANVVATYGSVTTSGADRLAA